jgi:hypothetical protein
MTTRIQLAIIALIAVSNVASTLSAETAAEMSARRAQIVAERRAQKEESKRIRQEDAMMDAAARRIRTEIRSKQQRAGALAQSSQRQNAAQQWIQQARSNRARKPWIAPCSPFNGNLGRLSLPSIRLTNNGLTHNNSDGQHPNKNRSD